MSEHEVVNGQVEVPQEKKMVLRAEGLVKKYGKRTVVNGVNFEVRQGEIVGLLGPNGAGKTTLIRVITRITMADSGRVAHAMLLYENEGCGALALAMAYLQYLNCSNRSGGDSCGECPSCRQMSKFIHPDVLETCQLSMGMTALEPGSVWNTMPAHTHERRMEVYFYFDLPENQAVFHMMGEGNETRHIVMHNEEAVISPSWSIHSGVGTAAYTFIWGMCGENQDFDDMDGIPTAELL